MTQSRHWLRHSDPFPRPSLNRCLVSSAVATPIRITVTDAVRVSGLLQTPARARACYVLAHGAGAGMDHPFMVAVVAELARRGIATLRYQFPYMERGTRRPDPPHLAQATVRAAVAAALRLLPELPLIGGGKSFGGRMTSQTQAKASLQGVVGLAFLGFPLHPAGRHRRTAPNICLTYKSRCCFCRALAIRWRRSISLNRSAKSSGGAQR